MLQHLRLLNQLVVLGRVRFLEGGILGADDVGLDLRVAVRISLRIVAVLHLLVLRLDVPLCVRGRGPLLSSPALVVVLLRVAQLRVLDFFHLFVGFKALDVVLQLGAPR